MKHTGQVTTSKTRRLPVEDHHDDCGESLAGLRQPGVGYGWALHFDSYYRAEPGDWLNAWEQEGPWREFYDPESVRLHLHATRPSAASNSCFPSVQLMMSYLAQQPAGTDVLEITGAASRTSSAQHSSMPFGTI